MDILIQLALVMGICLIGMLISNALPIPFPYSVISMVLLFILMMTGIVKEKHINKSGEWLMRNMAIMFLPSCVGILKYWDVIKSELVVFLGICFVTTILVWGVSAYTVVAVIKWQNKKKSSAEVAKK